MISHIQNNVSRLTTTGECNCLETNEIKIQFLIMLEIEWKSFGNRWPCFEVENLSTPSVIFGSHREIFGNLRKLSGNLRQSLEVVKYLRQSSEAVGKPSEIQVR